MSESIPASKRTTCTGCGKDVWRSKTSAAVQFCRECRAGMRKQHGTATRYKAGCRCAPCREAKNEEMRAYVAMVRERDGLSPTQKCRPAKLHPCSICGEPIVRGKVSSDQPMHNSCRPEKFWANAIQISDRDRLAIYERDRWTCQLCDEPVDRSLSPQDRMAATLDHITPRSLTLFPDDSPENLRLAHRACNSRRGNRVA